jgi:hypothetical protein
MEIRKQHLRRLTQMAIVTVGVIGVIGTAIGAGVGLYNAHENRKMQEKYLEQQNQARQQNMQLLIAMQQQNQSRQATLAMFLQRNGNGDIAQMMLGNYGQGQMGGQGQVGGQYYGGRSQAQVEQECQAAARRQQIEMQRWMAQHPGTW